MPRDRSVWIAAAATCALLAILHTWPLASAPGTLSRNDNGDTQLNEWILAWIAHQIPRAPGHLFDANIFYPARDVLAFSEPLVVPGLMGAPLAWLGASPVLVFNVMMLSGFALSALAGFALVYRWTGDRIAAMLTGSTWAFNTHTLTRLPHVQALHIYGLPLALLATDDILRRARIRDGLWLALWMTVMAYTSGYLVVFGTVMIGVAIAMRLADWRARAARAAGVFALAAALTALAVLPLAIPYARVAREQHMVRSLDAASEYSATLAGYLSALGSVHFYTWSQRFFKDPVDSFFPGVVLIGLSIVAIWSAFRRPSRTEAHAATEDARLTTARVLMLVAIAAAGCVLSLGPATPVYRWLFYVFPPMQGLRAAARFGNLFLLGMAAIGGLGLASWRRGARTRWATPIAIAFVVTANLEALQAPYEYQRFEGIPAVYGLLADVPGRVVLAEVPFYPGRAVFENSEYVLNSTAHWRPLMNGYSGYVPESYESAASTFWYFPEPTAIDAMHAAGVTHVMVHPHRFGTDADAVIRAIAARPDFELIAISRGIRLYRLR